LSSAEFDNSLSLVGSTPISSATQEPVNVSASKLSRDLISHLPSMRTTYLEIAPVSTPLQSQWVALAVSFSALKLLFSRQEGHALCENLLPLSAKVQPCGLKMLVMNEDRMRRVFCGLS